MITRKNKYLKQSTLVKNNDFLVQLSPARVILSMHGPIHGFQRVVKPNPPHLLLIQFYHRLDYNVLHMIGN